MKELKKESIKEQDMKELKKEEKEKISGGTVVNFPIGDPYTVMVCKRCGLKFNMPGNVVGLTYPCISHGCRGRAVGIEYVPGKDKKHGILD